MTFLEKLRCLFTFGQGVALPMPKIEADTSPFTLFETWFNDAQKSGVLLPESMSVSSVSAEGKPSSRMVLLKHHSNDGFIFYTNYQSKKSQDMEQNPNVALLFHWGVLQRQIRIEGKVTKISKQMSENYFHSRDRGSQIGAWASKQSAQLNHENELEDRFAKFEAKFANQEIPLPEFWGGWLVIPEKIEFWQGRASRLHDRVVFEKSDNTWSHQKVFP